MAGTWKEIVATVAPSLATAIGGPLSGLAVAALGDVFGLSDATQEQVAAAVAGARPDDLLKIKQAEIAFAQRMRELEIDLVRISAGDRDSARQRQIAVKDKMPALLATAVSLGFFGVLVYLLQNQMPESGKEVILLLIGALSREFGNIMSYYFGSSSGSEQKTKIMADQLKGDAK
jgi:hypothetical protein